MYSIAVQIDKKKRQEYHEVEENKTQKACIMQLKIAKKTKNPKRTD